MLSPVRMDSFVMPVPARRRQSAGTKVSDEYADWLRGREREGGRGVRGGRGGRERRKGGRKGRGGWRE